MKKLNKIASMNASMLTDPQMKKIAGGFSSGGTCQGPDSCNAQQPESCYKWVEGEMKEGVCSSDGGACDCSAN
jgi:hypothetical protein